MEELKISRKNHHRKAGPKTVTPPAPPPPPVELTLEQVYLAWHKEQYDSMIDTLSSAFGDNYEVTKHELSLGNFLRIGKETTKENEAIVKGLMDLNNYSGTLGEMRSKPAYTIIIHFPDLTVDNGRRRHAIKDLWVKIELSAAFCKSNRASAQYFTGHRSTFNYAEISSDYSFSHLSGGWRPQGFRDFCLGNTPFATLCADVHNEWNQNKFLMFCFQLHEYLSWESLDGGPFRSILDIQERNLRQSGDPEISSTELNRYYKKLLARPESLPVTFVKAPQFYGFRVKDGDEFDILCTLAVDNRQHLMVYDPVSKRKMSRNVSNKADLIAEYKREYNRVLLKFKGNDIRLVITDQVEEVANDDVPMRASDRVVNYLRNQLNQRFLRETTNEYTK